ncbi:nucleotidyltransferase family protein [Fimbriimonas ginsengisoli]|uniref:MobA-like protein-like protein n=1 Tax=Fimbriimonas ginsengisoli Gsoil 348 TaxID=661478 RepID=A0A068NXZ6_FIMGI|nr:nucleotidyltransferase family protein [Fimbriimonas ginsengisoli]AIE86529.1 MobA-like protein-like protein [Fimbriimonas ginsengisoli Gsoil 348]
MNEVHAQKPFAVVVLAAGGSARLGRPKQLLPYLGRTLVEHAVRTAIASGAAEVVVVLGAEAAAVRERLQGLKVRFVTNRDWQEGMGGSIRAGVAALSGHIEAAVIALADQPRITPDHLRTLAHRIEEAEKTIVASSYDGVLGAPCAFARAEFPRLLALSGDTGARALVRSGSEPVEVVCFDGANVDVDTPADYQALVPKLVTADPEEAEQDPREARGPPKSASPTS